MPTRKRHLVFHEGVGYPLYRDTAGWRMRSRSLRHPVNFCTGTFDLTLAKRKAREHLARLRSGVVPVTNATLEDVVRIYMELPKRAAPFTARQNVIALRAIVRRVWGRALSQVRLHELPATIWTDYMAKAQGRSVVDLASRRPEHDTINTAVRCARSIFIDALRDGYARAGITLPQLGTVPWLKRIQKEPAAFDHEAMLDAWKRLKNSALWWTIALARFAGLRRAEVAAARGGWMEDRDGVWVIVVKDRPDQQFYSKTGRTRLAPITHPGLIDALRLVPAAELVVHLEGSRAEFFTHTPQNWLRQFMGPAVTKPLHRLRAAYLSEVHASALMRMQQQAIAEAARAGGHTTERTTLAHYLPPAVAV